MSSIARAEATLLALDAGSRQPVSETRFRWFAKPHSFDRQELLRLLAAVAKPVQCSASVEGGMLVVKCEYQDAHAAREQAEQEIEALWAALARQERAPPTDPLVLLRGRSAALLLQWGEVAGWLRDYRLRNYSFWMKVGTDEAMQQGAHAVLGFGGPPMQIRLS